MAIENGVQNAELGYILDPAFQIENLNGKPVVGGYICIYEAGTDNKYISYENFDGAQNPFKIPLKADGRAVILGDPSLTYDVYAYDSYGNQLFSRLNVQCNVPGNISIKGADTRIKNTDGTLDISLQTIGNNVREYTVNTRNKELGVENPLYFVRNDESATIIGFSGDGYLTEDKFEYDDNFNITGYDGSAFASNGQTYSAGTNIDITDNVISVTGLPTSSDVENAISSAVTNVENKFEYNENNYITAYNNSAFAGTNYSAGDYVSIENDTISVTGLQPSGDYATKTELESATSGKMDVTGMTAYQPTGDYATHDDLTAYQPVGDYYSASNPSGFITNDALTGLQPSGDYATHDDLTAYATTSLVSSVSSELYSAFSGISGDYELVAGSGVELVDDPTAKTTTINVTAQGTPVTAIEQMIESATSGLQNELDYGYHDAAVSSIDASALYDTSAHARINTLAGRISNLSSDKLDTTAFSTVSGDFLTAHQDISNLMPKSESANFYPMTGNPSGFISEVPDTYLQNTDLEISDNKITGISGIPLAAGGGGDVPEGVMAESGLEFNTDNEISGYNGSAFALGGIPADAYTLSAGSGVEITDDQVNKITTISVTSQAGNPDVEAYVQNTSADIDATIINVSSNSGVWGGSALPISAGPGIKFEMVNDTLVASTDETVLFSGNFNTKSCTLSESPLNFDRVRFYLADDGVHTSWGSTEIKSDLLNNISSTNGQCMAGCAVPWSEGFRIMTVSATSANDYRNWNSCGYQWWGNNGGQIGTGYLNIIKVIGINRIAGGN